MTQTDDDTDGMPDISNRKLLRILMQEIVDVRRELKEDIAHLDQKLTGRIDTLGTDFQALRIEMHRNHLTFMRNHDALEQRVTVLEAKAA